MMTALCRRGGSRCGLRSQHLGQGQATHGQPADFNEAAPRQAVAERMPLGCAENRQHERSPLRTGAKGAEGTAGRKLNLKHNKFESAIQHENNPRMVRFSASWRRAVHQRIEPSTTERAACRPMLNDRMSPWHGARHDSTRIIRRRQTRLRRRAAPATRESTNWSAAEARPEAPTALESSSSANQSKND